MYDNINLYSLILAVVGKWRKSYEFFGRMKNGVELDLSIFTELGCDDDRMKEMETSKKGDRDR